MPGFMTLIKGRVEEVSQDTGCLLRFCYVLVPIWMLGNDLLSNDCFEKKKKSLSNHAAWPLLNVPLYSQLLCPTFILPYTDTLF